MQYLRFVYIAVLHCAGSTRDVQDTKLRCCQAVEAVLYLCCSQFPLQCCGCSSFELGCASVTALQRNVAQASAAVLLNFDQELHAASNEKPLEESSRAVQHCSRLTNGGACAEEQCGDGAAQRFLLVTLAPCREGEQCWDEACLQKGAYSAEMVHAFLLGVAERSGSAFSREEGCS